MLKNYEWNICQCITKWLTVFSCQMYYKVHWESLLWNAEHYYKISFIAQWSENVWTAITKYCLTLLFSFISSLEQFTFSDFLGHENFYLDSGKTHLVTVRLQTAKSDASEGKNDLSGTKYS